MGYKISGAWVCEDVSHLYVPIYQGTVRTTIASNCSDQPKLPSTKSPQYGIGDILALTELVWDYYHSLIKLSEKRLKSFDSL